MNEHLVLFFSRLARRVAPFFDMTAWVLLVVSLIPLWFIDRGMVLTLVQWTAFGLALAGIAVVITRVVLPQISLSEWLELARRGSAAAGLVVLGVTVFVSITILSLVLWARV